MKSMQVEMYTSMIQNVMTFLLICTLTNNNKLLECLMQLIWL